MTDLEKRHAQRDARRAAASRPSGSTTTEQALIRYLGVELHTETRRLVHPDDHKRAPIAGETDADQD